GIPPFDGKDKLIGRQEQACRFDGGLHGTTWIVPEIHNQATQILAAELLDRLLNESASGLLKTCDAQITEALVNFKRTVHAWLIEKGGGHRDLRGGFLTRAAYIQSDLLLTRLGEHLRELLHIEIR